MNNVIASLAIVLPSGLVQFQVNLTLTQRPEQLNMEDVKAVAKQVSLMQSLPIHN